MKKTILLAAMFATVASFADGNYVKFSTNVEKNFDTTYARAKEDDTTNHIDKGQALTIKAGGTEKAANDLKQGSQTENADKSVKFNDDANLSFGPEIKVTLGNSGFSFGGKLMNKTKFNSFDLSRLTLADGNSEAWGMFVLPKEAVKDLSSSVKFAIKTSKNTKNPELGLYNDTTKLDPKSDTDAPVILTKIDADSKDDVKYMTFDETKKDSENIIAFKSGDPKTIDTENSKLVANSYKDYMNDKSESVKTEGALDTTLDYALETKDLKSANIGLNTSTSFEFKKGTDFTTKYTAYADIKGETFAFRTELETANNYNDNRFKGFKYLQSNTTMKKGILDSSFLLYGSLDKTSDILDAYNDYNNFGKTETTDADKKNIVKKYTEKLEKSYLDAKKDDAKKIKEAYNKTLNTNEENVDKDADKALTDAKKDLITENIKKDDSLVYLESGLKLAGEPIENLKLGLEFNSYTSVIGNLGVKYSKIDTPAAATVSDLGDAAKEVLMKYMDATQQIKGANKLGLFAESTIFGINAKLSNDLELLSSLKLDGIKLYQGELAESIKEAKLMLQEKPALNLAYTYKYNDMFSLENKLGVSGIINFSRNLLVKDSKLGVDSAVVSIDPEINAIIKATDKLSFNAGTKVGFDILIDKNNEKNYKTEVMPSLGVAFKATDKLSLDSTTGLDLNVINSRILKSSVKFGGSLKYEW